MSAHEMIKVLFLAAIPQDTTQSQIDEEMRAIDQALCMAEYQDEFDLRSHWAVHYSDLQELLLRYKPQIVHFSGHGSAANEIILEGEKGVHSVGVEALSTLFAILKDNIRCVVLNACYSKVQARAIAAYIDCVIGMSDAISDVACIDFAAAFYQALGYGRSVKEAFDLGCNAIDLANLAEEDIPQLLALHSDPAQVVFVIAESNDPSSLVHTKLVAALSAQPLPRLSHNRSLLRDSSIGYNKEIGSVQHLLLRSATDLDASHAPTQVRVAKSSVTNLHLPRNPLVGRAHDVATVQHLLLQEHVGLLILTGPGGIGKTRLALQVAANLLDHFVDGVYFVSLAPISDSDLVIATIAQTLGLREIEGQPLLESLKGYLGNRQILLVLDNFEQVLGAAQVVADISAECGRLKILVTSRATLHLYDEHEFPVLPLALPNPKRETRIEAESASGLAQYAAVELFCQRAAAVKPGFILTTVNAAAVAKLCISLDGLPLALELAAARVKMLTVEQIVDRLVGTLGTRLDLLTTSNRMMPPRHQSLQAAIAWSYELLTEPEQVLLRRLSIFAGSFTLAAVEMICEGEWRSQGTSGLSSRRSTILLDLLAQLVDKSLLVVAEEHHGVARYRLLETIREYAGEQLVASSEKDAAQQRHAAYYLQLVEIAELQLRGAQAKAWLEQLETEHNNIRAALAWTLAMDNAEIALRLTGALGHFWSMRGQAREGKTWLAKSLSIRADAPIAGQAKAFIAAGLLDSVLGYNAQAQAYFEQGLNLYREVHDIQGTAFALLKLGDFFLVQDDYAQARIFFQQSLALYQELEDKWGISAIYIYLGSLTMMQGDYEQARMHFVQGLAHQRELGDYEEITKALGGLAFLACEQQDYRQAIAYEEESLMRSRDLEDKLGVAGSLNNLGRTALYQGDLEQASIYLAESSILAQELDYPPLTMVALANQGNVAFERGDYAQATRDYMQSLEIMHHLNDKTGTAILFERLAGAAGAQKKMERAIILLGAAANLRTRIGVPVLPSDQPRNQQIMAAARAQLNGIAFAGAQAQGEMMTLEEAVVYALTLPDVPISAHSTVESGPVAPLKTYPVGLTAREVEVLQLLAQGLTYVQIADKLVVSRRTINAHLTSIYGKLGVNGRAAATRFAVEQRLA